MKIDEKTLSILGAPKEGFEWVEMSRYQYNIEPGDIGIAENGSRWIWRSEGDMFTAGVMSGTGKFYRQVPIEPEPEVIVRVPGTPTFTERALLESGKWRNEKRHEMDSFGAQWDFLGDFIATQHKELKALKEKLGEIKKASRVSARPEHLNRLDCPGAAELVRLVDALEVE